MKIDSKLWDNWKDTVRGRLRVTGLDDATNDGQDALHIGAVDDNDEQWSLSLRHRVMYAVGCDIVGYSLRSLEGQLYLTTSLFAAIEVAIDTLRRLQWISSNEPQAILPTGDGALLVASSLDEAFAIVLAINTLIEELNRRPGGAIEEGVERQQPARILPCEVRYALATGRMIQITDVNGHPNFIGEALVTCSRILAASKGAHFLVEDVIVSQLLRRGGLNDLATTGSAAWQWGQSFHSARMQPRKVKTGTFTFYNFFGTYDAAAFKNEAAGLVEFDQTRRDYMIGSHDVTAVP